VNVRSCSTVVLGKELHHFQCTVNIHCLMGLVMHIAFVITDSGGLQKETYFSGKRALVVMPDTGWKELVEVSWNVLVDKGFSCSMTSRDLFGVYGKGDASSRIVQVLTQWHETNYVISDVTLDED